MEPDRFDDVEVRFLHDPEAPQQPPRRRRWVAGAVAAALVAGGFAAAASAGGGAAEDAAVPAAKQQPNMVWPDDGVPHMRDGKPCKAGERHGGHRERRDSDVSSLY